MGTTIGFGGNGYFSNNEMVEASGCIVFEPELFLSINIVEFCRINIGAGYRFVFSFNEISNLGFFEVSGVVGIIQVNFGRF